jgi:hypothetical protein
VSASPEPPERVRVTAPTAGRPRRTTVVGEIDAQTMVGDVYLRSLMRSQLRLAVTLALVLVGTVGLLPILFLRIPALRHGHVLGIPVAWLLLGACCYPVLIALGAIYVRRAERNEADFHDLVGPPR